MRGKTPRRNKAVEPIIAALLLIAIAVAASVLTYSWVIGMVGNQSEQAETNIKVDLVQFQKTGSNNDKIAVTVRNTGSTTAIIQTIYLTFSNNTIATFDGTGAYGGTTTQGIQTSTGNPTVITMTLPHGNYWAINQQYSIKVMTNNGFSTTGSYTSPSS